MKKKIAVLGMLVLIFVVIFSTTVFGDEESLHDAALALVESYYHNNCVGGAVEGSIDNLEIDGKLLIVDKYHNQTSMDYLGNLEKYYDGIVPKELLAENLNEVGFIMIIYRSSEKTGKYTDGAGAYTTYTKMIFVDHNDGTVYGPINAATGIPPSRKLGSGDFEGGYYPEKAIRYIVDNYILSQGKTVTWTLDENGTLTFSGVGDFDEFINGSHRFKTEVKKVIIENGITSICEGAFKNYSDLVSITIPNSVTKIGKSAFVGCKSLTDIEIPENVTIIGDSAFANCVGLTSIKIPDGVTSIGTGVFSGCHNLSGITIPDSVTEIGAMAFSNCISFTNVIIPENVTKIGSSAFQSCDNLSAISLPVSIKRIGGSAFACCNNLKEVYYAGTKGQWKQISIEPGNVALLNATIHYEE